MIPVLNTENREIDNQTVFAYLLTIEKSALILIIKPGSISKLQLERKFDQTLYSFQEETVKNEKLVFIDEDQKIKI